MLVPQYVRPCFHDWQCVDDKQSHWMPEHAERLSTCGEHIRGWARDQACRMIKQKHVVACSARNWMTETGGPKTRRSTCLMSFESLDTALPSCYHVAAARSCPSALRLEHHSIEVAKCPVEINTNEGQHILVFNHIRDDAAVHFIYHVGLIQNLSTTPTVMHCQCW